MPRRARTPRLALLAALALLCALPALAAEDGDAKAECQSPEALKGCGQCIKQNPDCAWCADPRMNGSQRCDLKSAFTPELCSPQSLFSPATEIKVAPQHNLPLGGRRADSVTPIQLEPQQVEIRMKPGDVVEIPFRYLHKLPSSGHEVKDFTIQTSEFRTLGLDIEFSIDCNGERRTGRVCPGVKPEQKTSFYAKISLKDCSNTNLIAVSVGVYGYNTVSAIFVTPLCGCECENARLQERRSPRCGYQGNLVCGACQCDPGKGGERCECELSRYGVSSADELIGQCREHRTAAVCSGKGSCSCGKCLCSADYINGRFCECDKAACPLNVEGKLCGGHGECECSKCLCEKGWSGDDCGCNDDPAPCTENLVTCSGNGYCQCGRCACNVGFTGATCNVEQPLPEVGGDHAQRDPSAADASSSSEEEEGKESGEILPSADGENGKAGAVENVKDSAPGAELGSIRAACIYGASSLLALLIGLLLL